MATTTQISHAAHPGEVLLQHGLALGAIPHLLASCKAEPHKWQHPLNLAIAHRQLGHYHDSQMYLAQAARLSPESWPIYHTWANVLDDIGEFKSSLDIRWRAWALCERSRREVALGLGVTLLRMGKWQQAWPYWELGRFMYSWTPPPGIKVWQGDDLDGKRLLILPEGGYGDTFDQARWIPELLGRGALVTLWVRSRQIELLWHSPELKPITLKDSEESLEPKDFDYVTSILSLPAMLEATPETAAPHITFDLPAWDGPPSSQRRLGLCWKAEENGTPKKCRSISGALIQTFRSVQADWFSLVLDQTPGWMQPSPETWFDTARLIQSLDQVVTVDTAVAHVAGCLGKPTICMIPINSEWRWLAGRTDTVWYPEMRVVRSAKPDHWEGVIREVERML